MWFFNFFKPKPKQLLLTKPKLETRSNVMTVPPKPHGCCSCPGPQGPQGIQGMQGPQGLQGASGSDGATGAAGPQGLVGPIGPQGLVGPKGDAGPVGAVGAQGPVGTQGSAGPQGLQGVAGPQGVQGLQGPPGLDCDNDCCTKVYCSLFSETDQNLTANGGVKDYATFESVGPVSLPTDFDLSQAGTLGIIKFLVAGVYSIAWDAIGMLSPPFPAPVPSWALGFYLNGVFLNGSGIAGFSQSPDDDANCLTSVQGFAIKAGDTLQLKNIAKSPIFLKAIHPELVAPATCASFSAIKIS
jgi:hypothetical protein